MESAAPTPPRSAAVVVRVAALWVAAGALFKLFAGTPNDLPPVVQEFFLGRDLTFRLAIAVELSIVLLAFLRPRVAWPILVALFVVFDLVLWLLVRMLVESEGVSTLEALFSEEASCGCFGSNVHLAPGWMILIDTILVVAVVASRPWRRPAPPTGSSWLLAGLGALVWIAPFVLIPSAGLGEGQQLESKRFIELDVESWQGEFVYDLEVLRQAVPDLDSLPPDATWLFYRQTCSHCAVHLAELAAADDGSGAFVLVRLVEEHDTPENDECLVKPSGGHVFEVTFPSTTQWVLTTPGELTVEGGTITGAREGIGRE
ncbi:MAG: hypothetical protein QF903_12080 [Planctomycetota bacterium]|jgi:hypothetical protein|nr:hypothetical protein [Planctomycetota bacterium]MDP6761687.1 hypothetical protein [Planctomycetota bacterium]MDP6990199.1 hypothetical protein [Planctomycetota bacterium]